MSNVMLHVMLQPRARYKQSLDPTVDDVKKLCDSLRRSAKVFMWQRVAECCRVLQCVAVCCSVLQYVAV